MSYSVKNLSNRLNKLKDKKIKEVLGNVLDEISEDYHDTVLTNLTGPAYGVTLSKGVKGSQKWNRGSLTNAGRLPVPQRTGNLKRSVQRTRETIFKYLVYADSGIARYGKFVHDGTRRMQKRPFMVLSMNQRKGVYKAMLQGALDRLTAK